MSRPVATVDAPQVPGGGPRWPGEAAERRARARGWIRWWWASAVLGVLGTVLLVAAFLVADQSDALLGWFGCWIVAVLVMVPAWRGGWSQRYDRYDDELCRYASGVPAEMSLRTGDGVVSLAGRPVGTSTVGTDGRRRVELDAGTVVLEERVLARDADRSVRTVGLRLVDDHDTVLASAVGERRGDRVDWTLDVPVGELRLRQRLDAVPSRRTVLDAQGRAWRIRGDAEAPSWTAELPAGAGEVDAVFVTWLACHLDAVGLACCYGGHRGPALLAGDGAAPPDARTSWRPVGEPGTRPEVPTASGGGWDIDL